MVNLKVDRLVDASVAPKALQMAVQRAANWADLSVKCWVAPMVDEKAAQKVLTRAANSALSKAVHSVNYWADSKAEWWAGLRVDCLVAWTGKSTAVSMV